MGNLNKTQKNIIIGAIIIVVAIIGYYVYGRETNEDDVLTSEEVLNVNEENNREGSTKEQGKIKVHITGAIQKEGIVELEENSRIADAVEAAGGLKEDADMSKINLAYILEDGMKIIIPSINDKDKQEENIQNTENVEIVDTIPESSNKSGTSTVNINKATQTELETLPGIGPSTALKIINYREENGKFTSIEDLKKISGIGESKFENIKGLISVK